jgi:hypothetical protein
MDNIIPFNLQQRRANPLQPHSAEIQSIHALRAKGLSLAQIAAQVGIPKSTVALRLKTPLPPDVDGVTQQRPRAVHNPAATTAAPPVNEAVQMNDRSASFQQPVQDLSCNHADVPSKIVQHKECTELYSDIQSVQHPRQGGPFLLNAHDAQPDRSRTVRLYSPWTTLARAVLLLIPVLTLTPWLVATTAQVYSRDVGHVWGWFLAFGIEGFVVALAILAPTAAISLRTPLEFAGSLSRTVKVGFWYATLALICFYNYQTTTLPVVEEHAKVLSSIASSSEKSSEMTTLRQDRSSIVESINRYETSGWLGEARRLREDLRAIDDKISKMREESAATIPSTTAAVEQRTSVSRYLRILALLINVICLHLIVRIFSESRQKSTRCT